jgi:CHAD domain-containing protein
MALDNIRLLKPVKKLRKLVSKMKRQPPPPEVHDLRTNARRFEIVFKALALDEEGVGKKVLRDVGQLRKRAGKARDMDVLTGIASTLHLPGEEDCSVQLLEYLGARRRKHAKRLQAELKDRRLSLRKRLKRTASVLSKLLREKGTPGEAGTPADNAASTAVKLASELAIPRRLGRQSLHPYRLKVKELQDVLRIASPAPKPTFVKDLGELKDAIGAWHDSEELVSIARKVLDHGARCDLIAELKRISEKKYEHALTLAKKLRATYFSNTTPPKKGPVRSVPAAPVWDATATLAG